MISRSTIPLLLLLCSVHLSFGAGKQLTGAYAPAERPPLSPADAQNAFALPDGFEARLFAAEPDVINPVAMTWDERGRLWVLELYEYPLGAPPGTRPRDRIKILEDTDNDGRADKVTIFADGLNLATGLLLGNGGVYVGQAPDLLFLRDTNHDDIADTREVLLTGFGLDDRHELLNGFTWGPDGWLYLTHGVFTHSKVKIPEASAPGVEVTAAVARFDPRTKRFEVFADGTSNPWGVDFDQEGNAFVSACVIDHLFHMAPGGLYARQGGTPANPYAYELLPSIVDHKHHMAAYCGICIYQGNQFPSEYQGHVFMGNIHQNALNHDVLTRNGSSFKAHAEKDFLTTSDGWFRPVSEQVGPDGALWLADWYDKYPCYQNAQADPEGVDRERGRIWRIVYTGKKPGKKIGSRPHTKMDLAKLSNSELVALLAHKNVWQRRMAQRLMRERMTEYVTYQTRNSSGQTAKTAVSTPPRGMETVPALKKMAREAETANARLSAFWTLNSVLWADPLQPLKDSAGIPDPAIRGWALKLAGQLVRLSHRPPPPELLKALEKSAADSDPGVRLACAVALREIISDSLTVNSAELHTDLPIGKALGELITHSADAKDPLLPFMIWMAGEPALAAHPEGGLKWLAENGPNAMPLAGLLARKAMLRICDTQDKDKLALAAEFLAEAAKKNPDLAVEALNGLIQGQQAKPLPPNFDTEPLFTLLHDNSDPRVRERGRELGTLWGNAAAISATLASINDSARPTAERIKAVKVAGELKNSAAREALLKVLHSSNPPDLAIAAVRALGQLGGDNVIDALLAAWPSLVPTAKAAAADVLASRRSWAIRLISEIEAKTINPNDLPLSAIRTLADSHDDFVRQRATKAIGRIRPANADKQKIIEQKKQMILSGGPPDLEKGHELARKTCFVCHKLYGEGADVGPDLTGVGRSSLDALLANVIDPNQVVGRGYENVMIETKDGRSVSGRLAEDTPTHIKLLSAGPKEEVLAKSDIASQRVSELSVMPEGLEQMPDDDFRNLILYVLHPPEESHK